MINNIIVYRFLSVLVILMILLLFHCYLLNSDYNKIVRCNKIEVQIIFVYLSFVFNIVFREWSVPSVQT